VKLTPMLLYYEYKSPNSMLASTQCWLSLNIFSTYQELL